MGRRLSLPGQGGQPGDQGEVLVPGGKRESVLASQSRDPDVIVRDGSARLGKLSLDLERRWCPAGHYQSRSSMRSQPSSMAFSIASASSRDRLPKVRARTA